MNKFYKDLQTGLFYEIELMKHIPHKSFEQSQGCFKEYDLKVYEQTASLSGNTNPSLAYDVVYETLVNVVGVNGYDPVVWSGTSNTYVIYNPDND